MLRRLSRSALVSASALAMSGILPATAAAQVYFQDCSNSAVCGYVQATLTGSMLSLRVQNMDNSVGSALYSAKILFQSAIGTNLTFGSAFQRAPVATPQSGVTQYGSTFPDAGAGWSAGGLGGFNFLDLTSFANVFWFWWIKM